MRGCQIDVLALINAKTATSYINGIIKDLLLKSFRYLQKKNLIEYNEAYNFFVLDDNNIYHTVTVTGLNDYMEQLDEVVCKELLETEECEKYRKSIKGSGKQLLYFLQRDSAKELLDRFYAGRKFHIEHDIYDEENRISVLDIINGCIQTQVIGLEIYPSGNPNKKSSIYHFCKSYAIIGFDENYPKVENTKELNQKIIELAFRKMLYVKDKVPIGDYEEFGLPDVIYRYNTNEMRRAINIIVPFLFCEDPEYVFEYDSLLDDYDDVVVDEDDDKIIDYKALDKIVDYGFLNDNSCVSMDTSDYGELPFVM